MGPDSNQESGPFYSVFQPKRIFTPELSQLWSDADEASSQQPA